MTIVTLGKENMIKWFKIIPPFVTNNKGPPNILSKSGPRELNMEMKNGSPYGQTPAIAHTKPADNDVRHRILVTTIEETILGHPIPTH